MLQKRQVEMLNLAMGMLVLILFDTFRTWARSSCCCGAQSYETCEQQPQPEFQHGGEVFLLASSGNYDLEKGFKLRMPNYCG